MNPFIINKLKNGTWAMEYCYIESLIKSLCDGMTMEKEEEDEVKPFYRIGNITVVPVFGPLGYHVSKLEKKYLGTVDIHDIGQTCDYLMDDPLTEKVVFYFQWAPGGEYTGLPELADKMYSLGMVKDTYCYTDSLMASAAYYLGSQCNYIYSSRSAKVGSIGVFNLIYDITEELKEEGIKINAIVSTGSKYKLMGAEFKELTDDERAILQAKVDKINEDFKTVITRKRTVDEQVYQGLVYFGEEAYNLKLCDGIIDDFSRMINFLETI